MDTSKLGKVGAQTLIGHPHGMPGTESIDYTQLVEAHAVSRESWDAFVRSELVPRWLDGYNASTPWEPEVMEIGQGSLTFLFDGVPTLRGADDGEDQVVAVWGSSRLPERRRDRARLAGFIPNPLSWSGVGRDRGHFVAHARAAGWTSICFPRPRA